ncbi:MAG: sensor histidine kinase [Verrucomicrobiales bacterium]|nr:sensor histidine kinase [Verrucomicrobiales bacterium]
MKTEKLPAFTRSYRLALSKFLKDPDDQEPVAASKLGRRALSIGLETLDLAKVHEEVRGTIMSLPNKMSRKPEVLIHLAGKFFAEAVKPIELTHQNAQEGNEKLKSAVETLTQRTKELSESNRELQQEIDHRKSVEESLRISERTSSDLLEKSLQLQEELRLLSRRLLTVQEEERKRISRDLHDLVAQTLTNINLQLATLKTTTAINAAEFEKKIEHTRHLVEKSVELVHRFARELRPALLDDLGLISVLQSYLKSFLENTGIRTKLTAFADVENLDNDKRTVLFRVAQEALSNVAQHAKASEVEVTIEQRGKLVSMEIHDNGEGFEVGKDMFSGKQGQRLGLLGIRERVEMIDGSFSVKSTPGKETTVSVEIPS